MKRARSKSTKNVQGWSKRALKAGTRDKQNEHDEARVAYYMDTLHKTWGGYEENTVLFPPQNMLTHAKYSGDNMVALTRVAQELQSRQPYFATFKQIAHLEGKVKQGSKSPANVKFYNVVMKNDTDEPDWSKTHATWYPVFHLSQVELPPVAMKLLEKDVLSSVMPAWMSKMNQLYEERQAKHPDDMMAMSKSAVPTLMQLASRSVLSLHHTIPMAQVIAAAADKVSFDLHPFLWPVAGIPHVEEYLAKHAEAWKLADHDALYPRSDFKTAHDYYNNVFFWVAQARATPKELPIVPYLRAIDHCAAVGIPFRIEKTEAAKTVLYEWYWLKADKAKAVIERAMAQK